MSDTLDQMAADQTPNHHAHEVAGQNQTRNLWTDVFGLTQADAQQGAEKAIGGLQQSDADQEGADGC